jgi:hypothetical protein
MDAHDALMEIENHADHTVKVKRAVNVDQLEQTTAQTDLPS